MRLYKVTDQLSYDLRYFDAVPREFTQQFLDNKLYMDQDGKQFKEWWTNPESNFPGGAIFAVATQANKTVGVGVVQLQENPSRFN